MKLQITAMRRASFAAALPIVLLVSGLCLSEQSTAQAVAAPTPLLTKAIDETRLVALKGSTIPAVRSQASTEVAPDDFKLSRMMLQLKRSDAQDAALKLQLDDLQNPKSPYYHRWLSPDEFGAQFGAAPEDITVVTGWLQSHGFTIDSVARGRNLIQFSGTQGQLRSAFHTEMRGYTIRNAHHWANASNVQIPEALAPVVAGIVSLNDVPTRATHTDPVLLHKDPSTGRFSQIGQWTPTASSAVKSGSPGPQFTVTSNGQVFYLVGPYDFATIYNLQPLWNAGLDGAGQTIAITARSNVNLSDIDTFRRLYGLPPKKLNVILPTGVDPGTGAVTGDYGDESETDLDLEWAGAVAKSATLDLVVSPNTSTTDGVAISDVYIVDENLAPVMSVSYGTCEGNLGASGNLFYNSLWEQAAAQGITVVVASGDTGPSSCDVSFQGIEPFVTGGLTVSGLASTPYNVAVGGTDFKTFTTTPGQSWSTTNDPATHASAKSYVPESPWNDSCENPEILSYLNANGASYPDNNALCSDLSQTAYQNFVGGGGGASNCAISNNTGCTGYPKPSWQSTIPGVPSDHVRDLPDVSLFAANGAFNSLLPYCQSDAIPAGYDCTSDLQGAGGTSFAAPAFAGIMAIVNQKTQSPQGVANYSLYKIATKQFSDSSQVVACNSSTETPGNACSFNDVTEGDIRVMCEPNTADCPTAGSKALGWDATAGYDLASGIGSINTYNLVNAWAAAAASMQASQASLTIPATTPYGATLTAGIAVAAATPGKGTPTGPVLIQVDGQAFSQAAKLNAGDASITLPAVPVGSHQITADYGGDATFDGSNSAATALSVTKASPALTLSSTRTTVATGQAINLGAVLEVASNGDQPTGWVTFTDSTSKVVLGTARVASSTDPRSGQSVTTATLTVPAGALSTGLNTFTASYTGDGNYIAASSNSISATYTAPFTLAVAPASLQIAAAANAGGTVAVNVTPAAGVTLRASNLTFRCGGTLSPGVSCFFSPATVNSSTGVASSTLTVQVNTSQIPPAAVPADHQGGRLQMIALSGLAGFMFTFMLGKPGKHRLRLLVFLAGMTLVSGLWGCGGSGHTPSTPIKSGPGATTTTLTPSSLTPAAGSSVTLQASVAPAAAGIAPIGTITFLDGANSLGTVALVNASASFSSNTLPLGVHAMTAKYSGDTADAASASAVANVDVTYTTNLTVTVNDNSGSKVAASLPVTVQ